MYNKAKLALKSAQWYLPVKTYFYFYPQKKLTWEARLKKLNNLLIYPLFAITLTSSAFADTIVWVGGSSGNNMDEAANWNPTTLPGENDVASFTGSNISPNPNLATGNFLSVDSLIFSGTNSYTLAGIGSGLEGSCDFQFNGNGVSNTSGVSQAIDISQGTYISFHNGAVASTGSPPVSYSVIGGFGGGSRIFFYDTSTAADTSMAFSLFGTIEFDNNSSADSVTITADNRAQVTFADQSTAATSNISATDHTSIYLTGSATAANATISADTNCSINFSQNSRAGNAEINTTNSGSQLNFNDNSSADHATITADQGSFIGFSGLATANNAHIILNHSTGMNFYDTSTAAQSTIDISNSSASTFLNSATAGSAIINVNLNAQLHFQEQASANQASIFVQDAGQANFYNDATAYEAIINITDSTSQVSFSDTSTAAKATINASNSSLVLFNNPDTNSAKVSLSSSSNLTCNANVTLGSLAGDSTSSLSLANSAFVTGYNDSSTTFSGTLSNTGGSVSITKTGKGTWTLTGNNASFTDPFTVNEGQLALNGSLGGNMTVAGGILSGTGTIGGNLNVSSGFVSPGNSIGTLTILGNYTPRPNGVYEVQIDNTGDSSLLLVSGLSALNGTVAVTPIGGGYGIGQTFTILQSGTLTGTFAGIYKPNPLLNYILTYDSTHAYLRLQTDLVSAAETTNEVAVATQFDNVLAPTGDLAVVIDELVGLPPSEAPGALNAVSGEQYTSLIPANLYTTRRFIRHIYDSLSDRLDPNCCWSECIPLDIWSQVGGGRSLLSEKHSAAAYKANNWDISLGLQATLTPCFLLGIAMNYAQDHLMFNHGGHTNLNNAQGAIYGVYRGNGYYVCADFIGGGSWSKFNRSIDFGALSRTAESNPGLSQGTFYGEIGIDYCICDVLYQPFLGIEAGYYQSKHLHESGADALNLSIRTKSFNLINTSLGVHLKTTYEDFVFRGDAAWLHCFNDLKTNLTNEYLSFGTPFSIKGIEQGQNGIWGVLNVSRNVDIFNFYLELSGEAWNHWSAFGVDVGFSIDF